jgi:hypothetical protein
VGAIVKFYRDLIDTYEAHPKGERFDLVPWKGRLASIQAGRDQQRSRGTQALLDEARIPVSAIRRL